MQKAIVTGASGFIGRHLIAALTARGVEVHCVSRTSRASPSGSAETWWRTDLTDLEAVRRLFLDLRPDVVFNLAGEVTGRRELDAVLPTMRGNLQTAVHAMSAALESGSSRFIQCGSMEEPSAGEPSPPGHPYAAAKVAASGYGRMFAALYELPVVLLRIFMVYGPGESDVRKLVPATIRSLLRGEAPLIGSGRRRIDFVFVTDVVDALLAAAAAPLDPGVALDVGSGDSTSIRELVERIRALVPDAEEAHYGHFPDRPLEHERVADIGPTFDLVGWQPTTPLDVGLARTIDWYRGEESE